jgi:hypothetical protein
VRSELTHIGRTNKRSIKPDVSESISARNRHTGYAISRQITVQTSARAIEIIKDEK